MKITFSPNDIIQVKHIIENFAKNKTEQDVFYNLCFCLLVPQAKFNKILEVVERLQKHNFYKIDIPIKELTELIKESRFKNRKASHLLSMKSQFDDVLKCFKSHTNYLEKRNWLVDNIMGFGMKAASHFLRNMGGKDLAIIDTHILKFLKLNSIKKYNYMYVEDQFRQIASLNNLYVAELDALVWQQYSKTPWSDFIY